MIFQFNFTNILLLFYFTMALCSVLKYIFYQNLLIIKINIFVQ